VKKANIPIWTDSANPTPMEDSNENKTNKRAIQVARRPLAL
jgi:hypothetical protein